MKNLIKENVAIVAAIVLPLILVIVFMLSTMVTSVVVDDPKHDFLIATEYYHNDYDSIRLDVVQNKLIVTYRYPWKDNRDRHNYNKNARLWRVHVSDMSIQEISMPLPHEKKSDGDDKLSIELNVPDISGLRVVNRQPGPDGYEYENSDRHRTGNLMTGLFSYNHHYTNAAIKKNGRTVRIKGNKNDQYGHNTRFIGWILE